MLYLDMADSKHIDLGVFIDPLTDFGFKFLFSEPNKVLLIGFLNAILSGRKVVVDVEYAPLEQHSDMSVHRGVIVDLYCIGENGERFIVEMQRVIQEFFKDRTLFYLSRIISQLGVKGKKWAYQLPEVYFIGIMDFRFDNKNTNSYFHDVHLMDINTKEVFYDKLQMIFIELPNYDKKFRAAEDMSQVQERDKWIYVLKHLNKLKREPDFLNEWIFNRIFKIAKVANLKGEERMNYESSLKAQRDYYSTMSYAEKMGFEKGVQKGEKQGIEKGKMKGKLEGKIEGKLEGKMEEIKNLILKLGLSDEEAANVAEVTIAFVKKVRKQIEK